MTIGILLGSTFVGGMERQAAYLSEVFLKNGHQVFIYTVSSNFSIRGKKKVDIPNKVIYPLYMNKYTSKLSKNIFAHYLKKHAPDAIIAFQVGSVDLAYEVCKLMSKPIPIIANLRGIKFAFDEALRKRHQELYRKVKLILCNSLKGEELIKEHIIRDNDMFVKCIPNIIKLNEKDILKPKNTFNLLLAANLKSVKDPLTLLKAMRIIVEKNRNIRLQIAGDGPLMSDLNNYVSQNQLEDYVSFLGALSPHQVPYEETHLLISTSLREASSNSILEALANQCCVVGTRTGGTEELLEGKNYGGLFEVGNYVSLAEKIIEFSEFEEEDLKQRGGEAKQYILNNHNIGFVYNEYVNALSTIVD